MSDVKTPEQEAIEKLNGIKTEVKTDVTNDDVVETEVKTEVKTEVSPEVKTEVKSDVTDDFDKIIKEKFKSKEEFDAHFTEHETLKGEHVALKTKLAELEKVSKANPFEDEPELYKILSLSKELKTKDYGVVGRLLPENLDKESDLEVIRLERLLADPDYKGRERILERSLAKEYTVQKPADYDENDPEQKAEYDLQVEEAAFKLSKDAKKIREKYRKICDDAKVPEKETPEQLEVKRKADFDLRIANTQKEWTAPMEEVSKSIDKMTFTVPVGKGTIDVDIEVPESMAKQKDETMRYVVSAIFNTDTKATPEGITAAKLYARNAFIIQNLDFIFSKVAEKARGITEEEWVKLAQNPSALKTADDGHQKGQKLTPEQEAIIKLNSKK